MEKGTLRKLLLIGSLVVIGMVLVVFLARDAIVGEVQDFRAERLRTQAMEAFEAGLWEKASRVGTAAHYLKPEDADIQLLVARALLKQRAPGSVAWWMRVIEQPDLPVEELRELTSILINSRRLESGLQFLNRLVELDPDSEETRRIWLQSLEIQRRMTGIMELAGRMVEEGSDDWAIHRQYLVMQRAMGGEQGETAILEHLRKLIEADSALSLVAAREISGYDESTREDRLLAAAYLLENGEDALDRLYAMSLEVREGIRDSGNLKPVIDEIVKEGSGQDLANLIRWSIWMGNTEAVLTELDFDTYLEREGAAEVYFEALLADESYRRLIELSESRFSSSRPDASIFMYYRALAWERLGDGEQARETLQLAVDVADPENTDSLERKLFQDERWDLLTRLYRRLLESDPENPLFLQKHLAANYYLGNQDVLISSLEDMDLDFFSGQPAVQGFILYLRMLTMGASHEDHTELERLLTAYPEIFDFRLILGVSYLLRDRFDLARGFLEGMPELTLRAPRFLRVCAVLLGLSERDLIAPGEREYLLPREQLLLSRFGARSTD